MTTEASRFAQLVCALSSRLAGATGERIDTEIRDALESVRRFFAVDHCGMMRVSDDGLSAVILHQAAGEGAPPVPAHIDYGRNFPAVLRTHAGTPRPYVLDRLEDIAPGDAVQLEVSRALRLGAYVGLPIVLGGRVRYSFALACSNRSQEWPRDQLPLMQALGETIARTIEREESEARVRRSEADLAAAQRVAQMGSWVRDFVSEGFSASEEAYRILGARPVSVAQYEACIHDEDRPRVAARFRRILRERRGHYEIEYRIVRPGGEVRLLADRGELEFDGEGRPLRAVGTLHDVTQPRRTEEELRDLRRLIWHADRAARASALGASLSHELTQPLAAILANAQAGLRFLVSGKADAGEMRRLLEAVVRDDQRAVGVIEGLRGLLRREDRPRDRVDVAEAVAEVVELLRGEIDAHGIELDARVEPGAAAWAVKSQVQQVALNLLSNAIEAVRARPAGARRISVGCSSGDGRVTVEIADSGTGVPADRKPQLFQPFHTTRHGGLGLGLSISRGIVEEHGGRIGVRDNDRGGATFHFDLPAVGDDRGRGRTAPPEAAAPAATVASTAGDGAPCVCVVDDDPAVREGLARLLASAGYAVAAFAAGEEFLASRERARAACVVVDVRMKGLSGPDLHERLAGIDPLLPVIFLTGHAEVATGVGAMRRGAVDFLQKPVDDTVLLRAVERAIAAAAPRRAHEARRREARARLETLSSREREILEHVVRGRLNKQIAVDLGIAEATVKQHRGRIMEKAGVRSVAELVRLHELAVSAPSYEGRIPGAEAKP